MSTLTHSSGQHLQAGDAQIYFELSGNPNGPVLLLLHGGLGSMADFKGIEAKLPAEFRLLRIDFRGHGRSTLGASGLSYRQYQADVEAVLEHLHVDDFSVLGFSDGGVTALRLAADTPARVKALVVVAAHSQMEPHDPVMAILKGMTAAKWQARFPAPCAYYLANNPAPDFDALFKAVVALWTGIECSAYPGATVRQITAPTLVVRGDEDHLYSIKCAAELRAQIKNSVFLNIPYAGHAAHEDELGLFLQVVNRFFTQRSPARGA